MEEIAEALGRDGERVERRRHDIAAVRVERQDAPLLDQRAGERVVEGPRRQRDDAGIGGARLLAGGVLGEGVDLDLEPGIGMAFEAPVGAGGALARLRAVDAQRQLRRLDQRPRVAGSSSAGRNVTPPSVTP